MKTMETQSDYSFFKSSVLYTFAGSFAVWGVIVSLIAFI